MSLRVKINLLMTLLMLVFIGSTAALQLEHIKRQIREEMTAGTKVTRQLLSNFLARAQLLTPSKDREKELERFLVNLGRIRAHEIKMINNSGDLLYNSPASKYKAGRNAPPWFTNLVSPKVIPFVIPTQGLNVEVIPNPSRAILDAWDELRELVILGIVFFIIVNLVVFWIIGRALHPVQDIVEGLNKMKKGDFQTRLPSYSITEFKSVTEGFNQMANAIELGLQENRKLTLAIEQSTASILITNKDGAISFWNPAAEKLLGYPKGSFEKITIFDLFPSHVQDDMKNNLDEILRSKPLEIQETVRKTKLGREIEVSEKITPIIEPTTDEVIGILFVIRDLTEQKLAEKTKRELEKNKELSLVVQSRLEEERKALAMELHDELGQYVTAIKSIAQSMANRKDEVDKKIYTNSLTIVSVASQIYDAVHNIIRGLRPISLENFGLIDTLIESVDDWNKIHEKIQFKLYTERLTLPREIEISLFRVIQECVNNAIKHSGAEKIEISIKHNERNNYLELSVKDDGVGISTERMNTADRFGLRGMRDRIQNLKGKFTVKPSETTGTTITANIPFKKTKDNIGELSKTSKKD